MSIATAARRKLRELAHLQNARRILKTPAISPTDDNIVLFSMVGTRVVLPYLVAVKSLHFRLRRGRVAILDDGTLTVLDRRILAAHLGDPVVISVHDVNTGSCPKGGTWERLLTLLDMASDDYVIQLDSDTVTVGDVPEVEDAISANRSFTLLGEQTVGDIGIKSLPDFMKVYHPNGSSINPKVPAHVQHSIEGGWDQYPDAASYLYVRGCSGFTGFARGSAATRHSVEAFSRAAESIVGIQKWKNWGSEQVASNFLIANNPNPLLLPYARYRNYWNEDVPDDVRFLHFIGTHRYSSADYRLRTSAAITALNRK